MITTLKRTILLMAVLIISLSLCIAEDSNRNEVRAQIAEGGWDVVWGDLINEGDYLDLTLSIASAYETASLEPLQRFFSNQIDVQVNKMQSNAQNLAISEIKDLILSSFKNDGQTFRRGNLEVTAGIVTYKRWQTAIYDEPYTYKCKQSLPLGGWTWSVCTSSKRVEKQVPLPNNHQPYIRFRIVSGEGSNTIPISAPNPTGPTLIPTPDQRSPTSLNKNQLVLGEQMLAGEYITSSSGRYRFIYQTDGNLVLYGDGYRALWNSGTNGKPGNRVIMQTDGNLVIYTDNDVPLWHTHTSGNPGAHLIVQDDGNVVVYTDNNVPLWNTHTAT